MAKTSQHAAEFDRELLHLPVEARRREWMGRIEAAIFASVEPVPREKLALLVGRDCRLDEMIEQIREELLIRPYDLALVAGGWQHRTRPRFADAIRAASRLKETGRCEFTQTESLVLMTIAYFQPITRAKVSDILGRDISRDTLAHLKQLRVIAAGPRMPQAGAPLTYVTTLKFLSDFGLATLRDLPNLDMVEELALPTAITSGETKFAGLLGGNADDQSSY
jgi:segregation and condensation protein B